jgi:hypothetical protein
LGLTNSSWSSSPSSFSDIICCDKMFITQI